MQQLTGDYAAAAVSHQQALEMSRDAGERYNQAQVLNSLGELSTRTAASQQARDYHTQALAIARELGVPLEEARAMEGIGRCHIQDGNPGDGAAKLGRHWPSTSASEPPMPSAFRKLSAAAASKTRFWALRARAKLLARQGQFTTARQLAGEAVALVSATCHTGRRSAIVVAGQ